MQVVVLSLALMTLTAGCRTVPRVLTVEPGDISSLPGKSVQLGRAFPGHPGARTRGFHVIRTKAEWVALWPEPLIAPSVDFSREMILVAFAGEKPSVGHSLILDRITREGEMLHVALDERLPSPDCFLPGQPTYPALLHAVPRHLGDVRFVVRSRRVNSCLNPPELGLSCHVENADKAYQNQVGTLYPRVGQNILCAAMVEPETRLTFELLGAPLGAHTVFEKIDAFHARLPIRAEGSFRIGVQAFRVDGMSSRQTLDFEAGIPDYEVALVEEEPEGVRDFTLEVLYKDESLQASPAAQSCSLKEPLSWCAVHSDGYETRFTLPATRGCLEVWIRREARAEEMALPQARLKIRLGKMMLFDEALPDTPDAWRDGRHLVTRLSLSEAQLRPGISCGTEASADPDSAR